MRWGKLKTAAVIVGLVAAFALWSFPAENPDTAVAAPGIGTIPAFNVDQTNGAH